MAARKKSKRKAPKRKAVKRKSSKKAKPTSKAYKNALKTVTRRKNDHKKTLNKIKSLKKQVE